MESITNEMTTIITLVLSMTVLELILPNCKNKKYVMFACSLIILLVLMNPVLKVFGSEINVPNELEKFRKEMKILENDVTINYSLEENIMESYVKHMKKDVENRLEDMGYEVLNTEIQIDADTYEPERIEMKIRYPDGYIQPIIIDVFQEATEEKINLKDISKIKEIFSGTYGISKDLILINGY